MFESNRDISLFFFLFLSHKKKNLVNKNGSKLLNHTEKEWLQLP